MSQGPVKQIAVVVTNFNQEAFLAEALESVQAQEVQVAEVVVVDDGSTVPVDDIVARFPGVTLIRQENQGVSAARNAGLAATSAEHVCFLDGDDRLLPHALGTGLEEFVRRPDLVMTSGASRLLHADPVTGAEVVDSWDVLLQPEPGEDLHERLLRRTYIVPPSTVLFSRAALLEAGAWTVDDTLWGVEDYELYLRLARTGRISAHREQIVEYRQHAGQSSRRAGRMAASVDVLFRREEPYTAGSRRLERARRSGGRYWRRQFKRAEALDAAASALAAQRRLVAARYQFVAFALLAAELIDRLTDYVS